MRVLIVIPAYNEEESILSVVRSVESAGYEYVVVNDGSTDSTRRICEENGINVVNLPVNLGIGGAVQTGHVYALENGYDADIQFDGDGQHDAGYIGKLVERLEAGSDLVIGSRFVEVSDGFQSTAFRRAGINWLGWWIGKLTKTRITDCTSGFRASGRKALELFATHYPTDYPEPESIVSAINHGLVVSEVPVVMHERLGGTSSISPLKGMYYMVKVTLAILIEGMGSRGRRK